jgi:hypothetical protein
VCMHKGCYFFFIRSLEIGNVIHAPKVN